MPQNPLKVLIQREPGTADLPLPTRATVGSAGMDLQAAISDELTLEPGERALVPTGMRIALPEGYEAQVRPRSGLAARHGIGLLNSPGTIDADFRGEIQVVLINLGREPHVIRRGDRIAQLVVAPVMWVEWLEVHSLPETPRGAGGFGHTGN